VVAGVAVGLVAGSGPAGRPRGARRRDRGGRHCLGGAERGLSVRLVEQSDFNAGTSSRSSKFVHGGLRYLKNGAGHLTCESVTARQRLLALGEGPGHPDQVPDDALRRDPAGLAIHQGSPDSVRRERGADVPSCGARQWPTRLRDAPEESADGSDCRSPWSGGLLVNEVR